MRKILNIIVCLLFFCRFQAYGGPELTVQVSSTKSNPVNLSPEDRQILQEHLDSLVHFLQSEKKDIQSFKDLKQALEAFEGEDEDDGAGEDAGEPTAKSSTIKKIRNFFHAWSQNYNFKRIFYSINRYVFLDKNVPLRESLKDIVALFCLSHGTEVAYGIVSVVVSILKGASMKVILAHAGIGIVIAMPGSDPLCWFIFGMYGASFLPKVGFLLQPYPKTVRFLRLKIGNALNSLKNLKPIAKLFSRIVKKIDPLTLALEKMAQSTPDLKIKISEPHPESDFARLTLTTDLNSVDLLFRMPHPRQSISLVRVSTNFSDNIPEELQRALKNLSPNLLDAIESAIEKKDQARLPFFVRDISPTKTDGLRITFTPGSIRIGPKLVRANRCFESY